MDKTYVKVNGEWEYLYRAGDKTGDTVDFLLRARRDKVADRCYFEKAIDQKRCPGDADERQERRQSRGARCDQRRTRNVIKIRPAKYLNNVVEQDHRAIKRRIRPMLGFKNLRCTRILLNGIEVMHMVKNAQLMCCHSTARSAAEQLYALDA
ncbi:DDE-type integrase/transposase/recombinase [Paraburkholderia phenoliruptrix]|uniref:IS6 family transposase ISBmu21 n=1 Tax=Paraburkholderia phenoliruptrix TaxID=252970 RepID=A0A6J5K4A1_9BURK|nr:DDE-type integrase/transposase/recombinase [Paraburkholderia phenoliruptrix]CAB4048590.1 IS6 family transposase ISBmu21 [Paraburkholderia phenoliruptrix]